jgi:hypothetical protein
LNRLPTFFDAVAMVLSKRCIRTYSSGSVQDFHLIPSSSDIPDGISETNAGAKVILFFDSPKKKLENSFLKTKGCMYADHRVRIVFCPGIINNCSQMKVVPMK